MAEKKHACKSCGYYTLESRCENCGAENQISSKPKGQAVIFNMKESQIGQKLEVKKNGIFALKY